MSDAIREAARALIQSVPPSFMDEANAPIGESTVAYAVDWSHLRNLRNAILAPEGKPVAPEELPYPYNFPQTNDPANAGAAPVESKASAKDVDKDAGCVCGRTGIEPHIPYGCSLSIPPRTAETPVERARREFVDVVRDAMASAYLSATGIPAHPTLTATSLDAIDAANQRLLAAERAERGGHRE